MKRAAGALVAFGLIAYALAAPFSITVSEIAMLIAIGGGAILMFNHSGETADRTVTYALVGYLLLKLITVVASTDIERSFADFYHYWPFLILFAVPLLPKTGPRRIILLRSLACSVVIASVYAIYQNFTGLDPIGKHALGATEGHYRALAFFSHHLTWSGFALVVSLFFAGIRDVTRNDRILFIITAVVALTGMLAAYARGPMGGLAVGLLLYAILDRRGRIIAATGLAAFLIVWAVTPGLTSRFSTMFELDFNTQFAESRTGIWITAWRIGASRPLVGVGPGNFERAFAEHRVHDHLKIAGHAHNQWLDEWATSGSLGVVGFTGFWLAVAWALWKRRRNATAAAALAAWLAISAAALFECHFSDEEVLMITLFTGAIGLLPEPPPADKT